ncbi:Dicer-like protein 1, partial [Rhizopus stolonifer]
SVLKFVTSAYLYVKNPDYQEGPLTHSRTQIISNKSLARLAKDIDLYQYIISGVTPRRFWRPPNFQCTSDESKKAKQWLTYHSIANNTLADAMESALGAAFLSGSLNGVVRAIRQFDIPMGIKTWTDIHAIYQLSPKSTLISWQIDLEALMHRSASNGTYERLEFLGDALLDYYVTTYIYQGHPTATPSILHSLRKSSVNHHILSVICLKMKLHKHIVYSAGSIAAAVMKFEYDHQRVVDSGEDVDEYWLALDPPKMLSDVVESLLGAMLVD